MRRVRGRQRSNRVCSPHPALLHLPRAPQTWKPLPSSVCLPYTNNTPTPSPRLAVYSLLLVMPMPPRRCLRCLHMRAREVRCSDAQLQLHATRHSHPRADGRSLFDINIPGTKAMKSLASHGRVQHVREHAWSLYMSMTTRDKTARTRPEITGNFRARSSCTAKFTGIVSSWTNKAGSCGRSRQAARVRAAIRLLGKGESFDNRDRNLMSSQK